MQEKKVYLYNELLIEMQKCHRNKQYEQMSEIYAEIDRIIYGEDECIPESTELKRLDNKTIFVPLLEDNSIELPKEIVKALNVGSSEMLTVTAVTYPDITMINVYKKLLYDFSEYEDICGFKPLGKYEVKIKNRRIQIKDCIIKAMNVSPYDTMQIDFLEGIMCIKPYQVLLPY